MAPFGLVIQIELLYWVLSIPPHPDKFPVNSFAAHLLEWRNKLFSYREIRYQKDNANEITQIIDYTHLYLGVIRVCWYKGLRNPICYP